MYQQPTICVLHICGAVRAYFRQACENRKKNKNNLKKMAIKIFKATATGKLQWKVHEKNKKKRKINN